MTRPWTWACRSLAVSGLASALGFAGPAFANAPAAPDGPDRPDEVVPATPEAAATLLVVVDDGPLGAAIEAALATELNDVEVALERVQPASAVELDARIEVAAGLVRERGALGLLWFEPRDDGLVVHLVVADAGMLRRPVLGLDGPEAAVEYVVVIARHVVTELIAGRSLGLTPGTASGAALGSDPVPAGTGPGHDRGDEPGADEPGADEPGGDETSEDPSRTADVSGSPLQTRHTLRFAAAYIGQAWAPQLPWQSGAELLLGWRGPSGVHAGASVAIVPRFETGVLLPGGEARYRVARIPIAALAGYQHLWSGLGPKAKLGLALDAQLRVVADVHQRSVVEGVAETRVDLDGPAVRLIPALEPRLQLDVLVLAQVSVFAALGLRVALVDVDYGLSADPAAPPSSVLNPNLVSPVALVGLGVFL